MKKIIITEEQLNSLIETTMTEYPVFVEHWESKFEKSVHILKEIGRTEEELINKINLIYKQ